MPKDTAVEVIRQCTPHDWHTAGDQERSAASADVPDHEGGDPGLQRRRGHRAPTPLRPGDPAAERKTYAGPERKSRFG